MTATSAAVPQTNGDPGFGTGRLLLADSRLAYLVANDLRHRALHGAFGTTREQDNLLTAILVLGAATGTYETARRILHTPLIFTRNDAYAGAFLMREGIFGLAGPASRTTPLFGTLLAVAAVGGMALTGLRRAAHAARETERRVRRARIARYAAAARERAAAGA
jgi:hypothetical protein